ncbi:MAG: TlpA disulfide reductase family protein [Pseudomonadota bacterium]
MTKYNLPNDVRSDGDSRRKIMVRIVRVLVAIGVGLGVYALSAVNSNQADAAQCSQSQSLAKTIDPFLLGDVAGLTPVKEARNLSGLTFNNGEGQPVTLADWSGRTVLLNLWATWCAPCLHEMPALNALQGAFGSDSFELVAVSVDLKSDQKPRAFYEKEKIDKLAFYQDASLSIFNNLKKMKLAIGMPTTVLIGPDSCAVAVLHGPAEWSGEDAKALIQAALKPAS